MLTKKPTFIESKITIEIPRKQIIGISIIDKPKHPQHAIEN